MTGRYGLPHLELGHLCCRRPLSDAPVRVRARGRPASPTTPLGRICVFSHLDNRFSVPALDCLTPGWCWGSACAFLRDLISFLAWRESPSHETFACFPFPVK